MKSLHIDIVGMTCEHCVRSVRNRLSSTAGVAVDGVDIGSADIRLDESVTTMADVEEAIADEGYTVDAVNAR